MDFSYSEEQEAVRELAGRIFSERVTHERLKDIETAAQDEGPIDRDLWHELAEAGLLGIALGESQVGQVIPEPGGVAAATGRHRRGM